MSDTVLVAIISTVGLIVVALLSREKVKRIGRDVTHVRNQVQNSHTVNLRDDLDEKFQSFNDRLDNVVRAQVATVRKVDGVARKQDAMGKRLDEHILGSESDDR